MYTLRTGPFDKELLGALARMISLKKILRHWLQWFWQNSFFSNRFWHTYGCFDNGPDSVYLLQYSLWKHVPWQGTFRCFDKNESSRNNLTHCLQWLLGKMSLIALTFDTVRFDSRYFWKKLSNTVLEFYRLCLCPLVTNGDTGNRITIDFTRFGLWVTTHFFSFFTRFFLIRFFFPVSVWTC